MRYDEGLMVSRDNSTGRIRYVKHLRDDNPIPKELKLAVNYRKKFRPPHTLRLRMRSAFRFDGSPANLGILETTGGEQGDLWAGPMVVHSRQRIHNFSQHCDVAVADLSNLMDFISKN